MSQGNICRRVIHPRVETMANGMVAGRDPYCALRCYYSNEYGETQICQWFDIEDPGQGGPGQVIVCRCPFAEQQGDVTK